MALEELFQLSAQPLADLLIGRVVHAFTDQGHCGGLDSCPDVVTPHPRSTCPGHLRRGRPHRTLPRD